MARFTSVVRAGISQVLVKNVIRRIASKQSDSDFAKSTFFGEMILFVN